MIMEYVRMKTKPTVTFLKIWYFSCRSLDVCGFFCVCVKEVWKYVPNNFQSERCLLKCILFNFLFSSTSRLGKGDYTISDETLMESERLTWSSQFHRFFSFLFFQIMRIQHTWFLAACSGAQVPQSNSSRRSSPLQLCGAGADQASYLYSFHEKKQERRVRKELQLKLWLLVLPSSAWM